MAKIMTFESILQDSCGGEINGNILVSQSNHKEADDKYLIVQFETSDGRIWTSSPEAAGWWALVDLRRRLEGDGFLIGCYGGLENVHPSGMSLTNGLGDIAYFHELGNPFPSKVLIWDLPPKSQVKPATISDQSGFISKWSKSLKKDSFARRMIKKIIGT